MVTPLERVVGFPVAEATYDQLGWIDQLILDLKIEGFLNIDIGALVGIKPAQVKHRLDVIRQKLAQSELHFHLELRQHYRDITPTLVDEADLIDGAEMTIHNMFEHPDLSTAGNE